MMDMPKSVRKFYKAWIGHFPESFQAWKLFYIFLHHLIRHSRKDRNEYWLKRNMKNDAPHLTKEKIEEYCKIFNHIKRYEKVWDSQEWWLFEKARLDSEMEEARKKFG